MFTELCYQVLEEGYRSWTQDMVFLIYICVQDNIVYWSGSAIATILNMYYICSVQYNKQVRKPRRHSTARLTLGVVLYCSTVIYQNNKTNIKNKCTKQQQQIVTRKQRIVLLKMIGTETVTHLENIPFRAHLDHYTPHCSVLILNDKVLTSGCGLHVVQPFFKHANA